MNNEPAFPTYHQNAMNGYPIEEMAGMSLRDYFAAKALPSIYEVAIQESKEGSGLFSYDDWRIGLALDAYSMADAMMKAREKKQ